MSLTQNAVTNKITNQITLPQDGVDNVEQLTVNAPFTDLLNNTYYLARTQVGTRPRLSYTYINTSSVRLGSFQNLWVSTVNNPGSPVWVSMEQGIPISIDATKLELGGGFAANTVYYLYAYTSSSTPSFQLSTTVPDSNLIFKDGNIAFRYIGHISTDAATNIYPMWMNDNCYTMKPYYIGSVGVVAGTTLSATADFSLPAKFPLGTIKSYIMKFDTTISEFNTSFFNVNPKLTPAALTSYTLSKSTSGGGPFVDSFSAEIPLDSTNKNVTGTVLSGAPVTTAAINADVYVTGYKE